MYHYTISYNEPAWLNLIKAPKYFANSENFEIILSTLYEHYFYRVENNVHTNQIIFQLLHEIP